MKESEEQGERNPLTQQLIDALTEVDKLETDNDKLRALLERCLPSTSGTLRKHVNVALSKLP